MSNERSERGLLLVVSSPSGAGKTTLCTRLRREFSGLEFSVSYTTRAPRMGEEHGKDYFFVDPETFEAMIRRDELAEYALVHGNNYGTSAPQVREALSRGRDLLFDIDFQGGRHLKLVDFGIATEQGGSSITESGQAFGSVSYAPPEWIDPRRLDPVKWDIYSLGVVLFELLTGRLAFPVEREGTSRQQALQVMIAKQDHPVLDRSIDVQINRLRRKIEIDPRNPLYLQTVRGEGYILIPD